MKDTIKSRLKTYKMKEKQTICPNGKATMDMVMKIKEWLHHNQTKDTSKGERHFLSSQKTLVSPTWLQGRREQGDGVDVVEALSTKLGSLLRLWRRLL